MARIHRRKIWDVDRGFVTPESAYWSRREILKAGGLAGLGTMGLGLGMGIPGAFAADDEELEATLKPVPGSAFTSGPRNAKYKVVRPMTEELVAARYNNFYEFGTNKERCWRGAQKLTTRPWTIEVGGLVKNAATFAIDELIRAMPCEERLYRFRCVERWAMVVPWSGFPFKALMDKVEPLGSAKFVRFVSFFDPDEAPWQERTGFYEGQWPYYEGLTIEEASNELAFVATGLYGHDIPKQHGAPLRMVVPWKYGYKGAKSIVKIEFGDKQPKTFWNDSQPREYGFYSNVNPKKPHPRWSQEVEHMIGTDERHDTLVYNGYGEHVAHLYKGDEH